MEQLRLRSPLYAQIELTYACNLSCTHCYNEPRFSKKDDGTVEANTVKVERTSTERFVDIAKELSRHDVFAVTLTGGEVFTVRDRLYSCIEALAKDDVDVTINSNLTLVNQEDARRLRELKVVGIMTSIASHDPITHDKIMNRKGSHEKTIRGTELMMQNGIIVSANMVVSRHNINQVYETGIFAHNLGMNTFSAAQAVPSNSGGKMHLEHALEKEQVLDYLEDLHRIRQDTGMFVRLTNPLPYCSVWEERPHLRSLVESSTCTAGRSIIQIDPTGKVKPCPMVNTGYGNILEEGLDTVWSRMEEWNQNKYVPETCKPCDLVDICRGACRAEAERMVGELEDKHPYSVRPVKLDKTEYYNQLEIGTRIVTAKDLRARKESEEVYVLFARDRYLVASENAARFISAVATRKGITVDEKLASNNDAVKMISTALESGILQKAS